MSGAGYGSGGGLGANPNGSGGAGGVGTFSTGSAGQSAAAGGEFFALFMKRLCSSIASWLMTGAGGDGSTGAS
jgi:hypothetical protein